MVEAGQVGPCRSEPEIWRDVAERCQKSLQATAAADRTKSEQGTGEHNKTGRFGNGDTGVWGANSDACTKPKACVEPKPLVTMPNGSENTPRSNTGPAGNGEVKPKVPSPFPVHRGPGWTSGFDRKCCSFG